jgi:choline dehydrogenase-like flavoprotein
MGEFDSHEKLEQSLDERVRHIMLLFGIGLDKANGQLTINEKNNELDLVSKYELNDDTQPIVKSITDMMKLFAKQIGKNGGDSLIIPFWDSKDNRQQITAHPLGGCPMDEDATTRVVNSFGQVFRGHAGSNVYENLYVIDGSIIPSPLGVNPSLTISALAFRTSEHITRNRDYWP